MQGTIGKPIEIPQSATGAFAYAVGANGSFKRNAGWPAPLGQAR